MVMFSVEMSCDKSDVDYEFEINLAAHSGGVVKYVPKFSIQLTAGNNEKQRLLSSNITQTKNSHCKIYMFNLQIRENYTTTNHNKTTII
jgi:hypothetical protein